MPDKEVVLIIGAPRSGTSALTRVLSLCGGALPQVILAPADINPTGLWEPEAAFRLNGEFSLRNMAALIEQGITMSDRPSCDEQEGECFVNQIQSVLTECSIGGPPLLVKDHSIGNLMYFWLEAARREGVAVKIIVAVRHPEEVYASDKAWRGCASPDLWSANWVSINLLAERNSRNLPRVFVAYSSLLEDWRREVLRVSKSLDINLNLNEAVSTFLTRDLHHQRCAGQIPQSFGHSWAENVYEILLSACQDRGVDIQALERICDEYVACDQNAKAARGEFRKNFNFDHGMELLHSWPIWRAGRDY